jgi:cation transport protein ChaC
MRTLRLTPELVARCFRQVAEPETPPEGYTALDEDAIVARGAELLAEAHAAGTDPIWIFAYGSLIWKPVFAPAEARRARAWGWRRAFSIELNSWRATPEAPGLMMALAAGGSCAGLAYRLDPATQDADLVELVRRETPFHELAHNARWINAATPEGPIRALTFYAGLRSCRILRGVSLQHRRASGIRGHPRPPPVAAPAARRRGDRGLGTRRPLERTPRQGRVLRSSGLSCRAIPPILASLRSDRALAG